MKIKSLIMLLGLLTLNGWGQTRTDYFRNGTVGGGPPVLPGALLSIVTVPEPQTWLIISGGAMMLLLLKRG